MTDTVCGRHRCVRWDPYNRGPMATEAEPCSVCEMSVRDRDDGYCSAGCAELAYCREEIRALGSQIERLTQQALTTAGIHDERHPAAEAIADIVCAAKKLGRHERRAYDLASGTAGDGTHARDTEIQIRAGKAVA